ncbi:MAG: methyltransferase domain-containing protein, partial [Candidatus ainarchaeum sp.]|nr:methyltransferase domain-containing protein [Candidatus ainarchaeum sp.]
MRKFPPDDLFSRALASSYAYNEHSFIAFEHRLRMADLGLTIASFFGKKRDSVAVDLGCGCGAMLPVLSKNFSLVIGVDILKENLLNARQLSKKMGSEPLLVVADIQNLPFKNSVFDFAL